MTTEKNFEELKERFKRVQGFFKELGIENVNKSFNTFVPGDDSIDEVAPTEEIGIEVLGGSLEPVGHSVTPYIGINFEDNVMAISYAQNMHILKVGRSAPKYGFTLKEEGLKLYEKIKNDEKCNACERSFCFYGDTTDCEHYKISREENKDMLNPDKFTDPSNAKYTYKRLELIEI